MRKNRIIAFILAAVTALAVTSCAGGAQENTTEATAEKKEITTEVTTAAPDEITTKVFSEVTTEESTKSVTEVTEKKTEEITTEPTEETTKLAEETTEPTEKTTEPTEETTETTEETTEPTEETTEPTEETTESTDAVTESEMSKILHSSTSLTAKAEVVASIGKPEAKCSVEQGGYTDGKYHYQLYIYKDTESNEEDNLVRLVKYDLEEKKVVQMSEYLHTNHSNDLTYNEKLNVLVAVHNNPNRKNVTFIDPETFEEIKTVDIGIKIYSMAYNAKRDWYVVGLSGGQSFRFLDADFKPVDDNVYAPTERTEGYTTQGVACDDEFIYFVLWNESVITVYDWDGNFVTLIELPDVAGEPENITVVDGVIYITAGGLGRTQLYKIVEIK